MDSTFRETISKTQKDFPFSQKYLLQQYFVKV